MKSVSSSQEVALAGSWSKRLLALHRAMSLQAASTAIRDLLYALIPPLRSIAVAYHPLEFLPPLLFTEPADKEVWDHWVFGGNRDDLWLKRCPLTPRLQVVRHTDHTPDALLVRSQLYRRMMRRAGFRFGAAYVVWQKGRTLAFVMLLRSHSHGDFTRQEMRRLRLAYPHVAIAIRRVLLWQQHLAVRQSLDHLIQGSRSAVLLLDWELRLLYASPEGDALCRLWRLHSHGARTGNTKRLSLPPELAAACCRFKERKLKAPAAIETEVFQSPRSPELSCSIRWVPVACGPFGKPLILVEFIVAVQNAAATSIESGRLTPREREVAALAARGKTNPEIARVLRRSVATVRNQLSSVFEKLNVSRRAELARLWAQQNAAAV